MNKKILITGALGHIGSRFIHSLQPGDYDKVVLLDNLCTQRYSSLFNLPGGVPFSFAEEDILKVDLERYLSGMDLVIHLAAITDAANSFKNQDEVERVNFEGTKRVAMASLKYGCKILFISTTSVYGTQEAVVDEMCAVEELKPQSPYAASKLKSEQFLQLLGEQEGLKFSICRFGTIFGTSIGMRFHTAINKFVWQACIGLPLTVWRTAVNQKRPYLDLYDAVRSLDFIIKTDRFDNQIYNVLTANATVREIIDILNQYVSDVSLELVDTQIMNQLSYEVLNERFRSLGFEFRGDLANAIEETISLLKNVRSIP